MLSSQTNKFLLVGVLGLRLYLLTRQNFHLPPMMSDLITSSELPVLSGPSIES